LEATKKRTSGKAVLSWSGLGRRVGGLFSYPQTSSEFN
jgi:hypothetical protein